ncbi:peroxiredoxin [Patescibacteria group bacterium]|nr:peroxiredoxin [Patescibacteria group bacterium]
MLKVGDKAPAFNIPDQNGKVRTLSDFSDKWLLLYFYPKDFTSGCTTEACTFRDNYNVLEKVAHIVGVSADSVATHKKFEKKHGLQFSLLADTDRAMTKEYGANGFLFPKRVSFLIDKKGVIRKIYKSVQPAEHADQVLRDINSLGI